MNFYALLALFAFFSYLTLGYLVLLLDRKRPINQIFFLYSLAAAAYSFSEFGYLQAESYNTAWIWIKVRSVWPFTFATALHFHLWLTKRMAWVQRPLRLLLIYLPAISIALLDLLSQWVSGLPIEQYGVWGYAPPTDSIWPLASGLYGLLYILIMIGVISEYFFRIHRQRSFLSYQAAYILGADLLVLAIVIINTFLQQIPDFVFINVDSALLLASNCMIAFAIWRYSLLRVTPAIASEEIVSNMSEFVFLVNPDGRIGAANDKAKSLSGFSQEHLEQHMISDILPGEIDFPALQWKNNGSPKHLFKKEILVTQSGNKIPVSYCSTPIRFANQKEVGWVYIGSQSLDSQSWNRQLDNLEEKVRQINKGMDQMVEAVYNDLSNSSRILYLLCKNMETKEIIHQLQEKSQEFGEGLQLEPILQQLFRKQEYHQLMLSEAQLLWNRTRALADFLEVSHESKAYPLDLGTLAQTVFKSFSSGFSNPKIQLEIDPLPVVQVIPDQMEKLFYQLFSNAFKFNQQEKIHIHIQLIFQDLEKVIIGFQDNGIGINAKYHDRVFEIFQQLHPQDQFPGNGMGLPICKKIIESHGGEIWIESREHQGTTVCFSLPLTNYVY